MSTSAIEPLPPHPDRVATTLAERARLLAASGDGPFQAPPPGSADARIDLKLLWFAARRAVAARGDDETRARLASVESPDLLAGTVQDGTARGVMVALEEAISLCAPAPAAKPLDEDGLDVQRFGPKELRRKKDIVVASGGARIRWSRKRGVLFVDRAHDVHEEDCIRLEDRRDLGTLDGFVADHAERPRLFSPAFLKPELLVHAPTHDRLVLAGRLGRRPDGFPCRLELFGDKQDIAVRMTIDVENRHDDHRLRIRFLSCRNAAAIASDGTPPCRIVFHRGRFFAATTLVRACGRLTVGSRTVPVPMAQCHGTHRHVFRLGGRPWRAPDTVGGEHARRSEMRA